MNYSEFIELSKKYWHKPLGLFFACCTLLMFEMLLVKSVGSDALTQVSVYLLSAIFLILTWYYSNRIPKTKKGKVGFVVSIKCSDDKEYLKIKEDFVSTLRSLLKHGSTGSTFDFIEIPQHLSNDIIDIDDAFEIKAKTKAHFIIYGRVRLRKIANKEYHIIDLEGIVGHKPIQESLSKNLSKEFSELFPRKVNIAEDNDLLSFNFTSELIDCVAKYIIGIAAGCSYDLKYAKLLFKDVEQRLRNLDKRFPTFKKINERLPYRLAEVELAFANSYLERWRETNDQQTYQMFVQSVKNIPDDIEQFNDISILKGIEAFLSNRDIDKAIEYTKRCKKPDDPVWRFNLAFLHAYQGQLSEAVKYYKKGMNYDVEPKTISEIEEFILWVLNTEPEKYQLYYCLGFFNRHIKGDLETAIKDFEKFVEHTEDLQFQKEKAIALKWISELKS